MTRRATYAAAVVFAVLLLECTATADDPPTIQVWDRIVWVNPAETAATATETAPDAEVTP